MHDALDTPNVFTPDLFARPKGLRQWIGVRAALGGSGGAGAVRAGGAFVELFAKDARLRASLEAMRAKVLAFGSFMRSAGAVTIGAGAAVLAPLAGAVTHFTSFGETLEKMSAKTGMSVEFLSKLAHAAQQSGTSLEEADAFIKKMSKNLFEASDAGSEARKTLEMIGLSIDELQAMNPEQRFLAIADALSKVSDAGDRSALMQAIGGRGGRELAKLFDGGAAGILAKMDEAKRLGGEWSREMVDNAHELDNAWGRVKTAFFGVLGQVGNAVAPSLAQVADAIGPIVKGFGDFAKENKEVIQIVAGLGLGLVIAGAAFIGLGFAAQGAAAMISLAIMAVNAAYWLFKATNPELVLLALGIGAVVAAAVGLGYVWSQTEQGQEAIGELKDGFADLWKTAKEAWGGIVAAVMKGDLTLAFKIAGMAIRLEWEKLLTFLTRKWIEFQNTLITHAPGKETVAGIGAQIVGALAWPFGLRDEVMKMYREDQRAGRLAGQIANPDDDPRIVERRAAIARLEAELAALIAQAKTAAPDAGPGKQLEQLRQQIGRLPDTVKGAFQSANWARSLGVAESEQKKHLNVAEENLAVNKDILKAVEKIPGFAYA